MVDRGRSEWLEGDSMGNNFGFSFCLESYLNFGLGCSKTAGSDMSQNQNGISSRFSSRNSRQNIFYRIGSLRVRGRGLSSSRRVGSGCLAHPDRMTRSAGGTRRGLLHAFARQLQGVGVALSLYLCKKTVLFGEIISHTALTYTNNVCA